jgi:uncharacterized SAM-binding protein YcdF (DUF218 family)
VRLLFGLLAGVVLLWLASLGLVLAAGARPELREADAIVVLGAAQYNGRPSPVFKARLDHALALYRQGLAPRLVFTGGVGVGDTVSEAEVARRYALAQGVPDSVILTERVGRTSAESIAGAAELLRERNLRTALIVSDSYHMLRTELLARRSGIQPLRAPAPEAPIDRTAATRWRFILRESVLFPAAVVLGAR